MTNKKKRRKPSPQEEVAWLSRDVWERYVTSDDKTIIEDAVRTNHELYTCNDADESLLVYAVEAGDASIVEYLLDVGFDPNCQSSSLSPYIYNAMFLAHDKLRIVKLLLSHKADPNVYCIGGEVPLHIAARRDELFVCRELILYGAIVDVRSLYDGRVTPLMVAAGAGSKDVVECLLDSGANRNLVDDYGNSASGIAKSKGFSALSELICNYKVRG